MSITIMRKKTSLFINQMSIHTYLTFLIDTFSLFSSKQELMQLKSAVQSYLSVRPGCLQEPLLKAGPSIYRGQRTNSVLSLCKDFFCAVSIQKCKLHPLVSVKTPQIHGFTRPNEHLPPILFILNGQMNRRMQRKIGTTVKPLLYCIM